MEDKEKNKQEVKEAILSLVKNSKNTHDSKDALQFAEAALVLSSVFEFVKDL